MDSLSRTIDFLVDRMELTCCEHCGCEIDVSDLTLFDQIICPECDLQGTVPCKLGPYLIQDRIGSGAMGTVYKANDEALNRVVAIKVLKKKLGENKTAINKFKREAVAIAQLNHPNIAQIYAFGEQNEQPYIVMEYLPGQTLKQVMSQTKQINQTLALRTGIEIARALEAASEVRIVHGDVKPENITYDEKGQAKLVDFGIATFDYANAEKGIFGTPYYIAPEKMTPGSMDTRADMYSLGATLFHALTGHPPFISKNNSASDCAQMRLKVDPPPLFRYRRTINSEINKIVLRMLKREPGQRYPTYASLIGDMQKALKNLRIEKPAAVASAAHRKTGPARQAAISRKSAQPEQKSTSRPVAIFMVIGLILILVAAGLFFEAQTSQKQKAMALDYQSALAGYSQTAAAHVLNINSIKQKIISDLKKLNEPEPPDSIAPNLEIARKQDANRKGIASVQKKAVSILRDIDRISERTSDIQTSIPGSRSLQTAAACLQELTSLITAMNSYTREADELIEIFKKANSNNLQILKDYQAAEDARLMAEEAKNAAELQAKERNARLVAIEHQNMIEKQERKKQIEQDEQKNLAAIKTRVDELIKINEFDLAFDELIQLHFKMDETKKAQTALKEKVSSLTHWKHWIVTQLVAAPIKEGWTENGVKYDITSAYDTGFRIIGGFVPWRSVPPLKLLAFFNYFMSKAQLDNNQTAQLYFAAMIYCSEIGLCNGVKIYMDKATEFDPSIRNNSYAIAILKAANETLDSNAGQTRAAPDTER